MNPMNRFVFPALFFQGRIVGVIGLLCLCACTLLEPKPIHASVNPTLESPQDLDVQSLNKALVMLSPLTLRVETDRYQSELFQEAFPESAEAERHARWMEAQFQMAGLVPAGDAPNSWRQRVPLTRYHSEFTFSTVVKGNAKTLLESDDFELWSTTPLKEIRIDRPEILFIPSIEEIEGNNAQKPDIRGKVILMRENASSSSTEQFSWAAHQGAAAALFIKASDSSEMNVHRQNKTSKKDHFILRAALGNPDQPLIMGRMSAQLAQSLFGVSEKNTLINMTSVKSVNATPSVMTSENIRSPIHILLKNTWGESTSNIIVGKIVGNTHISHEVPVVFTTSTGYVENYSLANSTWANASNFSALMTAAHALSQPGETPQKDILFVVTTLPHPAHETTQDDRAWQWWKAQSALVQQSQRVHRFDMHSILGQRALENDEAWIKAADQAQSIVEQGYRQSGPWMHH
jgi:hypothetical protein